MALSQYRFHFSIKLGIGPGNKARGPIVYDRKEFLFWRFHVFYTDRHRRELNDWNELLERQRLEVEQSKRNCESNKNINYSYLRSEDIAALKTYLTPDQMKLLDQPSPVDPAFMQEASLRLKDVVSYDSLSLCYCICSMLVCGECFMLHIFMELS